MKTDYELLTKELRALSEGVDEPVTLLANAAALLFHTLENVNWAGFYLLRGHALLLGPFQGKPACVRIESGRGVCGAAIERGEAVRVEDVHEFPGHIACDAASRSELVIPLRKNGVLCGVLDLDSPLPARFTPTDQQGLERFAAELERILEKQTVD